MGDIWGRESVHSVTYPFLPLFCCREKSLSQEHVPWNSSGLNSCNMLHLVSVARSGYEYCYFPLRQNTRRRRRRPWRLFINTIIGAFQGQCRQPLMAKKQNKTKKKPESSVLKIPTVRRQTTWLFTESAAKKLNPGQPRTNLVNGRVEGLNPGLPDYKSSVLSTWPRRLPQF